MARRPLTLCLFFASIVATLACAGAPCGEGTVKQDGKCVAEEEADADTDADADADADADSDTDTDDTGRAHSGSAPDILTFTTNIAIVTDEDNLRFTAVVTDPDGIDDLIGGTLLAPGGGTYGSFATASDEGSYTLSITWDDIDAVESINFTDSEDRTFVGRFYDQAGHASEAEVTVELSCGRTGYGACDGRCQDLANDVDNCGECGHACPMSAYDDPICDAGSCIVVSECVDDVDVTCDQVCRAQGYSDCNDTAFGFAAEVWDTPDTCATFSDYNGTWYIDSCSQNMQAPATADIGVCVCVE